MATEYRIDSIRHDAQTLEVYAWLKVGKSDRLVMVPIHADDLAGLNFQIAHALLDIEHKRRRSNP